MSFIGSRRALLNHRTPQFDFLRGVLPFGCTLARADATTCATYVNSSGLIATAAANVPRFTYDPVALSLQGLLNEATDTNSVINSHALTGTNWSADATAITDGAQTSPDGTSNASTVREDGTTAAHDAKYLTVSSVNTSVYPVSAFFKNIAGNRWAQLSIAATHAANFNPTGGALGTVAGVLSSAAVQQYSNGWWRLSALYSPGGPSFSGLRASLIPGATSAPTQSYAGDNSSALAITGVQYGAAGAPVGSYIATTGSAVTRAADVLTLAVANGTYTAQIIRLSGLTTLSSQNVSGGTGYTVPNDPSPVQLVRLRRTG